RHRGAGAARRARRAHDGRLGEGRGRDAPDRAVLHEVIERRVMQRRSTWISMGLVALLAAGLGCASTKTVGSEQYAGRLARPDRMLGYRLAASTADVQLDSSPTVEASWRLKGSSAPSERQEVANSGADAVADRLVEKIQALGLPAERASGAPQP